MSIEMIKKFLLWAEAVLLGALALKILGESWGAWILLQIIVLLSLAAVYIQLHKAEVTKIFEEIVKKSGKTGD